MSLISNLTAISEELSAGIWFFINFFCLITYGFFAFNNTVGAMRDQSWAGFLRMMKQRNFAAEVQASVALSIYFIGATIRAGYTWSLFFFEKRIIVYEPTFWFRYISAIFAIVGGLCILRVFTRLRYGHKAWVIAGFIAVAVPLFALMF